MSNLALKYRPQTLADVVGQELNVRVLESMVSSDRIPRNILFTGPSGTGKTTVARIVAKHVAKQDFNIMEIDAASHGSVAEMRKLLDDLRYSTGSSATVVLLDEVHSLSREAFNVLLKTLEEPPVGVHFFLLTTEPQKIPETIKTRTITFQFSRLTPSEVLRRLEYVCEHESLSIETELLRHFAVRSEGSLRKSLMLLDHCVWAQISDLPTYKLTTKDFDFAERLLGEMMRADLTAVYKILDVALMSIAQPTDILRDLLLVLRDSMVLRSGGPISAVGDGLEYRKALSIYLTRQESMNCVRILWDIRTKIQSSFDVRSDVELAVAMLFAVISRGQGVDSIETPPSQEDEGDAEMSLNDMHLM